ncbi:hypothetical protein [Mesorhizobium sp. M0843]|uniref:nSTAND1 domain-containing NTPase n=1 Tax=Mesorhizobium sp. M0843 TaxID=2957010 RepID=UPI00333B37F9
MSVVDTPVDETAPRRLSPKQTFRAKWRKAADDPQATLVNPYPGLRSFNVDEAHIFRARINQIRALRKAFAGTSPDSRTRHVIVVIGGSSSGKSSIVKAGLLADIHSLQMPDGGGNWYVAQCRPVQCPMQEFLAGLTDMVVDGIFAEVGGPESELAAEVEEALEVMGATDVVAPSPGDDLRARTARRVRALLDARLWSAPHKSMPAGVAPDLALFVREELNRLDLHLHRRRAGPPRLLISIDQFEEIFRCADGAEKTALFECIRFVDQAEANQAPELYLVASMRSEELHRCSELKGISDIVNRSVHLVELVLPDDVKLAIVEPVRLTLMGYGFRPDSGINWPFTPDAVEALAKSYEAFTGGNVEHRADALPLLQHFLRLLCDSSVGKWLDSTATDSKLLIDTESLSGVPGWDEPDASSKSRAVFGTPGEQQNRLARVLNSRADTVFQDAIQAWCDAAGEYSDETRALAEMVLKAAFVNLVRQDDRRRVVRAWRTIDEMLAASRAAEELASAHTSDEAWQAERAARFEAPLAAAMSEFERATLIERRPDPASRDNRKLPDRYTVYHESFIRNWKEYASWVREAGKASAALHSIYNDLNEASADAKPNDIVTAGREADLRAVIGEMDAGAAAIEPIAQEPATPEHIGAARGGWASQTWILTEISRLEMPGARFDGPGFLAELDNRRRDAILARKNQLELAAEVAEAKAQAANSKSQAAIAESREAEATAKAAKAEAETANANAKRAIAERREAEAKTKAAKAEAETANAKSQVAIAESRAAEAKTKAAEAKAQAANADANVAMAESREAEAKANAAITQRLKAEKARKVSQRWLWLVSAISCIIGILSIFTYVFYHENEVNQFRYTIAKLGLVGFEATEIGGGISRPIYRDRDLWLALDAFESDGAVDWNGADAEIKSERNAMRDQIAHRARQVLADLNFVPVASTFAQDKTELLGIDNVKAEGVSCLLPSAEGEGTLFSRLDKNSGPFEMRYGIHNGTLQYATLGGFRDVAELKELEPISEVCAPIDAATLLVISNKSNQPRPFVVLTQWNKVKKEQQMWRLQALSIRGLQSWSSNALYADGPIELSKIGETNYISNDTVVGFVVPVKGLPNHLGVLWTNRGYSAQMIDPKAFGTLPPLSPVCKERADVPGSRQCQISKEIMDTREIVIATYTEYTKFGKVCVEGAEYCPVKIQIFDKKNDVNPNTVNADFSKLNTAKVEFSYIGMRPESLKIDENYLWIQTDDKIVRKFDRRPQVVKDLISSRWWNLNCALGPDVLGDFATTPLSATEVPRFYLQERLPKYPDGHDCPLSPGGTP